MAALAATACHAETLQFDDVTAAALDRTADSNYRFDALWTDFNGDGCPDPFVFGHADPATSRLWLGDCRGRFELMSNEQVQHHISQPETPAGVGWMSLLDADGDQREDFWLRHASTPAARYINGTPAGARIPRFDRKELGCDNSCVFGDIDGDGTLDIVHQNRRVTDMLSGAQHFPPADRAGEAVVADLDGDTWPDLAIPEAGGYWANRGGRELQWVAAGFAGTLGPRLAADLDGDGDMDLVTVSGDDARDGGSVFLFRNDGPAGFVNASAGSGLSALSIQSYWTSYGNVVAADLDNDGLPELLAAGFGRDPSVAVLHNLGQGRFRASAVDLGPSGHGSEAFKSRVAVADYDGDGLLDLVKTQDRSNVGIWRNRSGAGTWMQVRVRGSARNSDAIGAQVRWLDGDGRLIAHQEVQAGPQHPLRTLHAGLGGRERVDVEIRFPHGGPAYRYRNLASNQRVVAFADGCLIEGWQPGSGWPASAPAQCPLRDEAVSGGSEPLPPRRVPARPATVQAAADRHVLHSIVLHRVAGSAGEAAVTFGIPLPLGALWDADLARIVDGAGNEVTAAITPTLRWHHRDGSIRALRVQLRHPVASEPVRLRFEIGVRRSRTLPGWPYESALVDGPANLRVPAVLATLDPRWMSASGIAGPQAPALAPTAYDRYYARQFEWAGELPASDPIAWLFDRPTALFNQYVRTGELAYLRAAVESYRFYMRHIKRQGRPGYPDCAGGWALGVVNACDSKFVYVGPILLALGLAGDDSLHDDTVVALMVGAWDTGGWNFPAGPYLAREQHFTEREAGLGLLAVVAAYELTGAARYREGIANRVGWLHAHQGANPDGLPPDGAWRHSWHRHEGADYDPASDVRGASPWMSENIADGLWRAWVASADARIPPLLVGLGRYLEQHGWIDTASEAAAGHDWRNPCSGADGQIAWYWSSSIGPREAVVAIQDSEGWYSDAHTVQLALPVALARYFDHDRGWQQRYDQRLARVASSYAIACAANAGTPRRFNWNHRGSGVVPWLTVQQPGSGTDAQPLDGRGFRR